MSDLSSVGLVLRGLISDPHARYLRSRRRCRAWPASRPRASSARKVRGHHHRRTRSRRRPRPHGTRAVSPRRARRSRRRSHRRKPDRNLQADCRRRTAHREDPAAEASRRSAQVGAPAPHRRQARMGRIWRSACSPKSARSASASSDGMAVSRPSLARESVAQWLDRIRAPQGAAGRRHRSARVLSRRPCASCRCWRSPISSPTKAPPAARRCSASSAATIAFLPCSRRRWDRVCICGPILRRVTQTRNGVTAALESNGRVHEARFDYLVCAMPATTLRDVVFEPDLPEFQRQAVTSSQVWRRDENRAAVRSRAVAQARQASSVRHAVPDWRGVGWKRGAARTPILTLLAGGGASAATREMLDGEGPSRIVRELSWLNLKNNELIAWSSLSWEHEPWSRGGYAFFDPQFPPSSALLARAPLRPRLLCRRTHEPALAGLHERRRRDGIARRRGSGGASATRLRAERATELSSTWHTLA